MPIAHIDVEGVLLTVEYTVDMLEDQQGFAPTITAVRTWDHGPDLTHFLDNMYLQRGASMVPVLTLIALELMRVGVH